jgi:hypothetical protein
MGQLSRGVTKTVKKGPLMIAPVIKRPFVTELVIKVPTVQYCDGRSVPVIEGLFVIQ